MNTSRPIALRFDDVTMWVDLDDGRTLGVPLTWFPRLLRGSPEQRTRYHLSSEGLHWDELDEDISVEGLLAGYGDMTKSARRQREAFLAEGRAALRDYLESGLHVTGHELRVWLEKWGTDHESEAPKPHP